MDENSKVKAFAEIMDIITTSLGDKRFAIFLFVMFNLTGSFILTLINPLLGAWFLGAFGICDMFMLGMAHNI